MPAGRKPKPTHLKLVTGNPGKRALPKREAKLAPTLLPPPDHLGEEAKAEWARVAGTLHDIGLLTVLDRAALAAYCQSWAIWVQATRAIAEMASLDQLTGGLMIRTSNGNAIQNPLVGTANKAAADMVRHAAEFGMTPSARSRIHANPPQDQADPADSYF